MRKRDLSLIIGVMLCFTMALGSLIMLQIEAGKRSERNIAILCEKLERLDGEKCQLLQPSDDETRIFAFIRRAESAPFRLAQSSHPCPVAVSSKGRYHPLNGPYRGMVKHPSLCFTSVQEAREAGFRAPG